MSAWHDLYNAKKNAQRIADEISRLLKEHNGLMKKEIAAQSEKLAEEVSESIKLIEEECSELIKNMESHRKTLLSKSRFLRRHNKTGFIRIFFSLIQMG